VYWLWLIRNGIANKDILFENYFPYWQYHLIDNILYAINNTLLYHQWEGTGISICTYFNHIHAIGNIG
jgi:hypothetical protein